jgi:Flp pilus assembly protein TadG
MGLLMSNFNAAPLLKDTKGIAAIEFALLLPIFLIICLGVIEFGMYFVKDEIANSTVSTITLTLERDPAYFDTMTTGQKNTLIAGWGSGLIKFSPIGSSTGNYICADAYTTAAAAQSAPLCTDTHLNTANPNGAGSTTPYYVSVRADLKKGTITPLGNFIPATKNIQVNQTSGAVQVGNMLPPVCDQLGQSLQWNGTNFICVDTNPPSCMHPWQRLESNGSSFVCVNQPYVVAGGVARPLSTTTGASPGNYWDTDKSRIYGTQRYLTLCERKITFAIPTGLPPGQLIAQGNLIYTGAGGDGDWHAWTISFTHMNLPLGGGTGSMDVCESSGGNWNRDNDLPAVGAEHVSWAVVFIPN